MNDIISRAEHMINELGLPVLSFCRNVGISPSTFYRMKNESMKVSNSTAARIDEYLKRYGF